MNFRIAIRVIFAISLLLSAAWLAYPGRNSRGNPSMEELVQSCATQDGTSIHLYVGNGGATTSYWYTVTTENGFLSREKQVLFSYDTPQLSAIDCGENSLTVSSTSGNIILASEELDDLRNNPRLYWRGKLDSQSWDPLHIFSIALAGALALAGFVLVLPIIRQVKKRRSQGAF